MSHNFFYAIFLLILTLSTTHANDFFSITSVKLFDKVPQDGYGVWRFELNEQKRMIPTTFEACLEIKVKTRENMRARDILAKVYFFDDENSRLAQLASSSEAGTKTSTTHFASPVLFEKDKIHRLFFKIPQHILTKKWKAAVVFGDKYNVAIATYPKNESHFLLDFPEKSLLTKGTTAPAIRHPAMDPLITHVSKTNSTSQPEITLFLRPPKGVSNPAEVKGVLAVCALANSVESLKRDLQMEEMSGDYQGLFKFANDNKLAILAWGSRHLWVSGKNYDDLTREQADRIDREFDLVANGWERGVKELSKKYGLPEKNFLLWGMSAGSHWAHRLCLRKPEYFAAIHIHVATSYDKPTPSAASVLWCVTTGEKDPGYKRSIRFYEECRRLNYPIIYKAIINLGHAGHPATTNLGFEFFKHALRSKVFSEQTPPKEAIDDQTSSFSAPLFYGDIINQSVHPSTELQWIPQEFCTPLPSKEIAQKWSISQ